MTGLAKIWFAFVFPHGFYTLMHQDKETIVTYWEKLQGSLAIISHTFTYKEARGTWFDFICYIEEKMVFLLNRCKYSTPSLKDVMFDNYF